MITNKRRTAPARFLEPAVLKVGYVGGSKLGLFCLTEE